MLLFNQIDYLYRGLQEAAEFGRLEVIRYIIKDIVEYLNESFDLELGIIQPLQIAAKQGHVDNLSYFVEEMPYEVKIKVDLTVDKNFINLIKRKGLVDIAVYSESIPAIQEDVKCKLFKKGIQKAAQKIVNEFFD